MAPGAQQKRLAAYLDGPAQAGSTPCFSVALPLAAITAVPQWCMSVTMAVAAQACAMRSAGRKTKNINMFDNIQD
jgi:hypothetical protein